MTKLQASQNECAELRALLANTIAEHAEQVKVLNAKLFAAHSARAKLAARLDRLMTPTQSVSRPTDGETNAQVVARMRAARAA